MKHHAVFEAYQSATVIGDGRCLFDFLGVATDSSFKKGWNVHALPAGRSLTPGYPVANEHYFDWIALLDCVTAADCAFRMAELGAGWGPWLVRGAFAARQKPAIESVELLGVEADSTHYRWLLEHCRRNGIDPDSHRLIHGAVSAVAEVLRFPRVDRPDENYGASLLDTARGEMVEVDGYLLTDLLDGFGGPVDFLHVDIQGAEYDVLPAAFDTLDQRVKAIMVGTHLSDAKHDELAQRFRDRGWVAAMLYPRNSVVDTPYGTVRFDDGFQYWLNPRFRSAADSEACRDQFPDDPARVRRLFETAMGFEGMTTEHGIALMDLFIRQATRYRSRGAFVESGVHKGRSSAVFAHHLVDGRWLHAVDPGEAPEIDRLQAISPRITWHRMKSETFCSERLPGLLSPGEILVSHHDASHFFENVATELELIEPYLSRSAIVILDDFNDPYGQVRAAYYFLRYCRRYPYELLLIAFNKAVLVHEDFFDRYEAYVLNRLIDDLGTYGCDASLFRTDIHPMARGFHVRLKQSPTDPVWYGTDFWGDKFYSSSRRFLSSRAAAGQAFRYPAPQPPKADESRDIPVAEVSGDWRDVLRARYPWPEIGGIERYYFSLDGGGRDLIIDLLREREVRLMVEVGCFLCGSTLQWLQAIPELTVVGVDPWALNAVTILERYVQNPVMDPCFVGISDRRAFIQSVGRYGLYASAMANVAPYRERFFPVKASSPMVLQQLHEIGLEPELIYFDSDKVLDDLRVSHQLFPNAILCGDDWTWGADQGYPVQRAVRAFCEQYGFSVRSKRMNWVLEKGGA